MPNIFLTDDFVYLADCPAGKDQEIYWDHPIGVDGRMRRDAVSGLGLRVTMLGRKSFIHAYQFNGQRYRKVIGSPEVLPFFGPPGWRISRACEVLPFFGPPGWRISRAWAHGGWDAPEPFMSDIGGLLPIAL